MSSNVATSTPRLSGPRKFIIIFPAFSLVAPRRCVILVHNMVCVLLNINKNRRISVKVSCIVKQKIVKINSNYLKNCIRSSADNFVFTFSD